MNKSTVLTENCTHKQTVNPPVASMTGYKMITTLWTDFNIADVFASHSKNLQPIVDTYNSVMKMWNDEHYYKELTELCLVLNWKSWEHLTGDQSVPTTDEIGSWYADKFYELRDHLLDTWKNEDNISYLLSTLD